VSVKDKGEVVPVRKHHAMKA